MQMAEKRLEIHCNRKMFVQGCMVIVIGLFLPAFVTVYRFDVYGTLKRAMDLNSGEQLLIGALKLVVINIVRAVPNYLGVFLLNESIQVYLFGKRRFIFNAVFTVTFIMELYRIIDWGYGIRYDFGVPALLIVGFVLFLSYIDLFSINMINKLLIVFSLLLSIQWLDVVTFLGKYGFGRGDASMDVKIAAAVAGNESLLNLFALCMFAAFLFASLMQVQILYKEHKLKVSNEKTRQVEKELYNAQIQALKMRNYSEVQSLVHDLKTPLTTIQGLISLVELMESEGSVHEYFEKISDSLSAMNMMISEILHEDRRSAVTTEELMRTVLAQVSITVPPGMIRYDNECPDAQILGNRIRLSRAVINVITNAWYAVEQKGEENKKESIRVQVYLEGASIVIQVRDRGVGISPEKIRRIWELGYSGRHSTGLGLAFTRQVVENHRGTIEIESEEGHYTEVTIVLRKEEKGNGEYEKDSCH